MDKNKTLNFTLVAKTSGTAFVERETYQTNTKQRAFGNENRFERQKRTAHVQKGKWAFPPHSPTKTKQQRKPQLFCETTFKGLNVNESMRDGRW